MPGSTPLKKAPSFGDYELLERIGGGGMGLVFKARQRSLNRIVALKLTRAGPLTSTELVGRFRQEAQVAAQLQHPNIVSIHEIGETEGQHFYSMDFVEGPSLAELLREHALPPRRAATYLRAMAQAVQYAHEQGIIHRDLKPSNILIDRYDQPRVADFGLAKWLNLATPSQIPDRKHGPQSPPATGRSCMADRHIVGTPSYMAPELTGGYDEQSDARTDIYALGAILFELLTGRPPFKAGTPAETLRLLRETDHPPLRLLNPSIPRDLETICGKCLAKNPTRRYATAQDLANDLNRFLREEPVLARPTGRIERSYRWCHRRPKRAMAMGAVFLLTLFAVAGVLSGWKHAEEARHQAEAEERRAQKAEAAAVRELRRSLIAQARADRWSGRPGRRFEALDALAKAAAIQASDELRNEVAACLALSDVQVRRQWTVTPALGLDFDSTVERYVCADDQGNICLCRVADGSVLTRLAGGIQARERYFRFSPDGLFLAEKFLAQATNGFRVWSLLGNQEVLHPAVDVHNFVVRFSPLSDQVVGIEPNGLLHVWWLDGRGEAQRFLTTPYPNDLCFDPAGKQVAVCSERSPTVVLFDLESGQCLNKLIHPSGIHALSWHPLQPWLACGGMDHAISLWNVATSSRTAVLTGHTAAVTGLVFDRGGDLLVSTGLDGKCRFWDSRTGTLQLTLPGSFSSGFSPHDDQLGFQNAPVAGVWTVTSAPECRRLATVGPVLKGNCASFSQDGRLLALGTRQGTFVWNVERRQLTAELPTGDTRSSYFHPATSALITSGLCGVQVWSFQEDGETVRVEEPLHLWTSPVEHSEVSRDGRLLVAVGLGKGEGDALLLYPGTSNAAKLLTGHPESTWVSVSPDGGWFASGNWKGREVCVRDLESGRVSRSLPLHENVAVDSSPDGAWLVTGAPTEYRFWDTKSWLCKGAIPREDAGDEPGAMAFSPDGALIALASRRDSSLKLFRVRDLEQVLELDCGIPLCFSPDGSLLATLSEDQRTVLLWNLRLVRKELANLHLDWEPSD